MRGDVLCKRAEEWCSQAEVSKGSKGEIVGLDKVLTTTLTAMASLMVQKKFS